MLVKRALFVLSSMVLGACTSGGGMPPTEYTKAAPATAEAATPATDESEPAEKAPPREVRMSNEPVQPLEPLPTAEPAAPPPDPKAPLDLNAPPADAEQLPSGLASKVLQGGAGTEHPGPQDTVKVKFSGWMTSGVKFDSSEDRGGPVDFVLSKTIQGWIEGIPRMVAGEKRRFWVPGKLAYGDERRKFGAPYGTLVFDIELVSFRAPPAPPEVPADLKAPPADARRTSSGLAYRVLRPGTGKVHPRSRSTVEVHYSGWDLSGKMFDSSVARGETSTFPLNGVIRGWTEGVQLMVVGEKARFWIPSKMAYGDSSDGTTPSGPLVFDIELIDIKKE
jgi:FKBP-type peptidyl-prolyl cis-trans isomerase